MEYDSITTTPSTQAIKYTGSKLKLLPYILNLSKKVLNGSKNITNSDLRRVSGEVYRMAPQSGATVFDGFSGSTRVSQAYAKTGYKVYANDIAPYSKFFNTAFLLNTIEKINYKKNVMAAMKRTNDWIKGIDEDNLEYLFLMRKK